MTTASAARIGQPRDWPQVDTLDELGLSPDQLRRDLVGIPEGWGDRELRGLAKATHVALSIIIGEMRTARASLNSAHRALAGMVAAQVVTSAEECCDSEDWDDEDDDTPVSVAPSPWPEWSDPGAQTAWACSRFAGWGSTGAPWRRIA